MSDMFPFTEKSRLSVRGNRSRGKPAQNYCIFAPDRLREKVESPFLHNIIRTVHSANRLESRACGKSPECHRLDPFHQRIVRHECGVRSIAGGMTVVEKGNCSEDLLILQDVVERQFVDDFNILTREFQLFSLLMLR